MRSSLTVAPDTPRTRILAVATRLFLEHGIRAVAINRIVAAADVALMTVYRQFGGKDELVAATIERWSAQLLTFLNDRLDQCGDHPQTRFTGLWSALEEWQCSQEFRGSLVGLAATELRGSPHHPAHEAIAAHRAATRRLLVDVVRLTGVADPADLAAQLHLLVEGVVVNQPADAADVRRLANAALLLAQIENGAMRHRVTIAIVNVPTYSRAEQTGTLSRSDKQRVVRESQVS
jgi:AcrR family transcriptional regulator